MPDVEVLPANQLTQHQFAIWSDLQDADPSLDSPFFCPEFTQMVARVRDDVEVAVVRQGRQEAGFFPFQRNRRDVALPVCGRLNEFHGVIAERGVAWNAEELIRHSGLRAWHFDHLITTQTPFFPFHLQAFYSPYLYLGDGFEKYVQTRRAAGCQTYAQIMRKTRKIEKEVGPLRFEFHTRNPETVQALVTWKSSQHKRTRRLQVFRFPWVVELMNCVQATQGKMFAGVVSALYAGNRLIAVHFGIRSRKALHIWFPAFDRAFEKYSPGLILLIHLARAAAEEGIERIDFGKGSERYKTSLKTGDTPIAMGVVDTRPLVDALRRRWQHLKKRIRSTRGKRVFDVSLHMSHHFREWMALR